MRTKLWRSIGMLLTLLLPACGLFQGDDRVITGSGRVSSETRPVTGIDSVALEGLGDVVVRQGTTEALTIEAEDNLLPLITSTVQAGTLRLGFDRATWRDTIRPTKPIRFVVVVETLQALELTGSGSLHANDLHTDSLLLRLSGSGEVVVEHLESSHLVIHLDGAGAVQLAGVVTDQVVEVTGNGQVQAGDLESQNARVTISGTGDVVLWARTELAIGITGSGTVSYWGDPHVSQRDITGTGDINPMGVK